MSDQARHKLESPSPETWRAVAIASGLWGLGFAVPALLGTRGASWAGGGAALAAAGAVAAVTVFGILGCHRVVDRKAERDETSSDEAGAVEGLRAAVELPQRAQRWFVSAAALTSPIVALVAATSGSAGVRIEWGASLMLTGVALGAASGVGLFYALKRVVKTHREVFALSCAEPRDRTSGMPLRRKAGYAVGACVAAATSMGVTVLLSDQQSQGFERLDRAQHRLLASVIRESENATFEESVARVLGDPKTRLYPMTVERLDLQAGWSTSLDSDAVEQIAEAMARGEAAGEFSASGTGARVSFRGVGGDEVAVAVVAPHALDVGAGADWVSLLFVLAIVAGCSFWLSQAFADDLRDGVITLSRATDQMAKGDLRRLHAWESEDELGVLWRSQEKMGTAFRTTVQHLAEAADRVDAAAGEIEGIAGGVAGSSVEQVRRIQQASELMVSINSQVMEVAGAAQELNVAVEESSSSILELGSTGDELNETASVLGSKVDEVSSSIEQMVLSVKQVGSSSDGLADAAAETSASMEEMASAMRAVDTTAEATAELSRGVVASAESGQEKVSQTIDGMQAIRDATDTAESVIRGLGARTQEIGAILDVIDDVAEETNLLALNAAIIAAQAGEHGRAFSVVAEEIKELADRVLASTKEIGGLIKSVQDESDNAVGAIEVGSRSVGNGVELSADAGLSLEEITRSSRESGQRIGEIVSAVREQTKAASHVVALMDTVRDGVTAIVSASADQDRGNEVVYRSSVTMRDVTQQVRRTTEEQSRGFVRIRESIEGVREVVENINSSLQEQMTACSQVTRFLEQVFERTRSNEEAAGSMNQSVHGLIAQAESLRENVSRFRT